MIPLRVRGRLVRSLHDTTLGLVTSLPIEQSRRSNYVLRLTNGGPSCDLEGYAGVLCDGDEPAGAAACIAQVSTSHLQDGDVVALDPSGQVRTLFRKGSRSNFLFTTDRCNSYCLMCSQPPRIVNDEWRVAELLRLIELLDTDITELGITGGEPTLLKDDLIALLVKCRDALPTTAVHVLSNGRLFYYGRLAKRVADVQHPNLMFGIPVYSDLDWNHDYVVQARGAFAQTMTGLQNLGRFGVPVEIRVVLHRLTITRLEALAEFVYRNLTFASHVAFMGLETIGLAVPNLGTLWVDPWEYRAELERATLYLAERGMKVSIYNHQLCTVPTSIWPFCRQSISDWKNEFLPVCDQCVVKAQCGGFFTSSLQRRTSAHINPFHT
jgi:His-Xaa-Ser system radical SAM maturase HxsC